MGVDAVTEQLARQACASLQAVLRDNLHSCVLYGSAVRGNLVPGRSDINLLIVLDRSTPQAHQAIADCLRQFGRVSPLVLSRSELPGSRRVFAVKFRSIRRHYVVLCGQDPLADFDPPPDLLRLLCEQALRNLSLRLQHAFITLGHDRTRYARRLVRSVPALFTTISEVLRCGGVEVPNDYGERPALIGRELDADASVLDDLLTLRRGRRNVSAEEALALHSRLFELLGRAINWVEQQWRQAPGEA